MAEEEVTKSIKLPVTIDIALRNIKDAKVGKHEEKRLPMSGRGAIAQGSIAELGILEKQWTRT